MEYTLVLGIEYKKYKRPATINLFIGGQFLDSFEMHQDQHVAKNPLKHVDRTWYDQNGRSNWLDSNDWKSRWYAIPTYYRIYKLPEETLNGQLEIQVKNDSNDYTNGFMKNSSLIKFTLVALLPSKLLMEGNQTLMGFLNRAHNRMGDDSYPDRQGWPTAVAMFMKTDKKNYVVDGSHNTWIGGNFTAVIDIKTKHKVKYLHSHGMRSTGIGIIHTDVVSQLLVTLKPLINIYNENQ